MNSLSILTWNVNGLRAVFKKGFIEILHSKKPDIVCLQEIKCFPDQAKDLIVDLGSFQMSWHPAKRPGYSGVLTLFRGPVQEIAKGIGQERFDEEGRVLIHDLGFAELLNCYFPNGGASEERHLFKMDFLRDFLNFATTKAKQKPLIITGDINIAHREIDIHDPVRLAGESGFKPEERAWMDEFLSSGFIDAFRDKNPDAKERYTWWSYRAGARQRNKGWRIDYFLLSESLKDRIIDIQHFEDVKGSDHCPLWLEVKI